MTKWSDAAIRVTEWLVVATVILLLSVFIAEASNPDQMYADGFECRVDCPPPVDPIDYTQCTPGHEVTDPLRQIQPLGFARVTQSWVETFSATGAFLRPPQGPVATFPNTPGSPVAVPCRRFSTSTSACVADKGTYTVVPFVPTSGLTVDMSWDNVQANPAYGYRIPRPADSMFVGVSNCAGDFRAPDALSVIPMLQNGCRRIGSGASVIYSTLPGASNEFVCRLNAGETYYINIAPLNPMDGIDPGEHTCSTSAVNSLLGCDAQFRSSGTFTPVLNQIGDILGRDWSKR